MGDFANEGRHNLEPGLRLDRYELLCILAQGGMANVWLARIQGKHGFAKLVAIKTILPHIADDEQFKQMFLDEARVASNIEHPNVVQINDVGDHLGISYLVMDLVEGESLQRLLKACEKQGQRVPLGVALRILADACLGLDAAHELADPSGSPLHVVHRDVSPQNILVTVSGTAKVIDFGIAKARDRVANDTSAGTLKGKISFMPREQALGRPVDRRADTWALGAILYLLLSGRPPYKDDNELATLQLVMKGADVPPLPTAIPSVIRAIAAKALRHDPAERYQTARELGAALEQAMVRLGVTTTHSQVARFLHDRIGDRLQARRDFIASALAEASNRERVRGLLTAPANDPDGSGSLQQMMPVAIPENLLSRPQLPSGDTAPPGTLAATTFEAPTLQRWWPALGLAAMLAVTGLVVAAVGVARWRTSHRAAIVAAAPTASEPKEAASALPPLPAETVPIPVAADVAPIAPATTALEPLAIVPQRGVQTAAPTTTTTAPAPHATKPVTAPIAPTSQKKKAQDDEAGF